MSNAFYLHGQPANAARFLRVTEHRRLEQLLAADKRLDQMRDVLGSLEKTSASATRAPGFPMIAGEKESKRDRRS